MKKILTLFLIIPFSFMPMQPPILQTKQMVNPVIQQSISAPTLTVDQSWEFCKIGEDNDPVFITPNNSIIFSCWKLENYIGLDFSNIVGNTQPMKVNNTLIWNNGKQGFYIYKYNNTQVKLGIILNERPKKAEWELQLLGYQEFNFWYQPELTPSEIKDGAYRDKNAIGSYSVYHKWKRDHVEGQTNYKWGKTHNIYPIVLIDSMGNRCRADLLIYGKGRYKISATGTQQQKWLSQATYPVWMNDTFGDESDSSTGLGVSNAFHYSRATSNPTGGTLTSMTMLAAYSSWSSENFCPALYSDSSSLPNAKLAGVDSGGTAPSASKAPVTTNISYGSLTSTQYWLGFKSGTSAQFAAYYDEGGTNSYQYDYDTGNWPDTAAGIDGSEARYFSIYATYTAGAGASVAQKQIILGSGVVLQNIKI